MNAEALIRRDHGGCRILVVDDEPVNLEVARYLLEDAELRVDTAEDGDGIEAYLHHGKEVARLGLQCQHLLGVAVALVGHHLQLDLAGGGKGDLGE